MNFTTRTGRRPRGAVLSLAGMIDVTFLLLVYFMATTVIAPREDRLGARVESQGASTSPLQPQQIDVRHDGGAPVFLLGGHRVTDGPSLTSLLRALPADAGVSVSVSPDVPVAWAFIAVQSAHDAGHDAVTWGPSDAR